MQNAVHVEQNVCMSVSIFLCLCVCNLRSPSAAVSQVRFQSFSSEKAGQSCAARLASWFCCCLYSTLPGQHLFHCFWIFNMCQPVAHHTLVCPLNERTRHWPTILAKQWEGGGGILLEWGFEPTILQSWIQCPSYTAMLPVCRDSTYFVCQQQSLLFVSRHLVWVGWWRMVSWDGGSAPLMSRPMPARWSTRLSWRPARQETSTTWTWPAAVWRRCSKFIPVLFQVGFALVWLAGFGDVLCSPQPFDE